MFPSKPFCLTVPNNFIGEPFTVALISGIEKIRIREGEYQKLPSKTFCLTVPTFSVVGIPSVFLQFQVSKSFMLQRVMSRSSIFCRIFFVSQCRKNL